MDNKENIDVAKMQAAFRFYKQAFTEASAKVNEYAERAAELLRLSEEPGADMAALIEEGLFIKDASNALKEEANKAAISAAVIAEALLSLAPNTDDFSPIKEVLGTIKQSESVQTLH